MLLKKSTPPSSGPSGAAGKIRRSSSSLKAPDKHPFARIRVFRQSMSTGLCTHAGSAGIFARLGPANLAVPPVVRVVTTALKALDLAGVDEKASARPAPRSAAARPAPERVAPHEQRAHVEHEELVRRRGAADGILRRRTSGPGLALDVVVVGAPMEVHRRGGRALRLLFFAPLPSELAGFEVRPEEGVAVAGLVDAPGPRDHAARPERSSSLLFGS